MTRISCWIAAMAMTAVPTVAFAHPGHGVHDPGSLAHVILDFPHALWLIAAAVGAVACLRLRSANADRSADRSDAADE